MSALTLLGDPNSDNGRPRRLDQILAEGWNWEWLRTQMAWPQGEPAGRDYVAAVALLNAKSEGEIAQRVLAEMGGEETVVNAPPLPDLIRALNYQRRKWHLAAVIFHTIRRLALNARVVRAQGSLLKAAYLVEKQRSLLPPGWQAAFPKHSADIINTWSSLKPAAHLIAAAVDWHWTSRWSLAVADAARAEGLPLWVFWARITSMEEAWRDAFGRLPHFLAAARELQDWATTYISPHHKGFLLEPDVILSVPRDLELPSIPPAPLEALTQDEVALLRAYKAPKASY